MDGTLAEMRLFAGNFAPRNWSFCQGQLLAISTNQALFSLLGTTYGGDGRTSFGLPDARGRLPVGTGHGPGLDNINLGEKGGQEREMLNDSTMPFHNHIVTNNLVITGNLEATITPKCSTQPGNTDSPEGNFYSVLESGGDDWATANEVNTSMGPTPATLTEAKIELTGEPEIKEAGNSIDFSNIMPVLGMNFIICVSGVFPSRN